MQRDFVYSYIRAERSYGNECSVLTFPFNYPASVTLALTFMNLWHRTKPQWLAKDIIVLFYDDSPIDLSSSDNKVRSDSSYPNNPGSSYSASVGKFLKQYYLGHDPREEDMLRDLLDDDKVIHGRCGYLRQAFPFIFKDYEFSRLTLHL
jgi:hypothetical protein